MGGNRSSFAVGQTQFTYEPILHLQSLVFAARANTPKNAPLRFQQAKRKSPRHSSHSNDNSSHSNDKKQPAVSPSPETEKHITAPIRQTQRTSTAADPHRFGHPSSSAVTIASISRQAPFTLLRNAFRLSRSQLLGAGPRCPLKNTRALSRAAECPPPSFAPVGRASRRNTC